MLRIYDFECNKCKERFEDMLEDLDELPVCPICSSEVKKIFTTMNFKLVYNPAVDRCTWADDGYKESQYWKDYKAAKARGEDVMPATELVKKS